MPSDNISTTRRHLLQGAGTGIGAALGLNLLRKSQGIERFLEETQDAEPSSQALSVAAAQPTENTTFQYMGGPQNRGYTGEGLTPTGVKNIEKIETNQILRPPGAAPEGNLYALADGAVYVIDPEAQEIVTELPAAGGTGDAAFFDEKVSYGDPASESARQVLRNWKTGEEIGATEEPNAGDAILTDERLMFTPRNKIVVQDKETGERIKDHPDAAESGAGLNLIVTFGDGNVALQDAGVLRTYDMDSEEVMAEKEPSEYNVAGKFSTDGDRLYFGATDGDLHVLDLPTLDEIASEPMGGSELSSSVVIENKEDTEVYTGDSLEGILKGFQYDHGTEDLEEMWSVNTEGVVNEKIGVGDAIIASTDESIEAYNRHNGEIIWKEDIGGRVGYPNGEYLPFNDLDGNFRTAEMEMGQLEEGGTAGLPTDPGEPGFGDVLEVIQSFNTNSEYADTGVTPGFSDVLEVIQAFNAG